MKKTIILLLALLMSVCSSVKPVETLSSMQADPIAEMTVTETVAPEETTETAPKEIKTGIETPNDELVVPSIGERTEQKPTAETSAVTILRRCAEFQNALQVIQKPPPY